MDVPMSEEEVIQLLRDFLPDFNEAEYRNWSPERKRSFARFAQLIKEQMDASVNAENEENEETDEENDVEMAEPESEPESEPEEAEVMEEAALDDNEILHLLSEHFPDFNIAVFNNLSLEEKQHVHELAASMKELADRQRAVEEAHRKHMQLLRMYRQVLDIQLEELRDREMELEQQQRMHRVARPA